MGSSTKKHKTDKKRKRSRSQSAERVERSREKHRHHRRHHKDRKKKTELETEEILSSDSDVEEVLVPPPPKISRAGTPPAPKISSPPSVRKVDVDPSSVSDGKSHDSLSIEETNKLRAKLGLKPLQTETVKPASSTSSSGEARDRKDGVLIQGPDGEFVHKPATNFADKSRGDKVKERLTERKEKRQIENKLKSVKGLGESDSDEDTKAWVSKTRQKEKDRSEADKRAKLLEELDAEFGIGELIEEEKRADRHSAYTSRHLKGLRVGHSAEGFDEGRAVILTLKDSGVLDEKDDVLVNVNMIDNERYKKNLERKKKPDFDKYGEEDELGERGILSKYDEEIEGEKSQGFALGEEDNALEKVRRKLLARNKQMDARKLVSLNTGGLQLASEYYTPEEMSAKFKKPRKIRKMRKKSKTLKADDLMPKEEVMWPTEDLGSRRSRKAAHSSANEGVAMDIVKDEPLDDIMDVDDVPAPLEDLSEVKLDPDEGELELQLALSKARKLKQKEKAESSVEKIAMTVASQEQGDKAADGGAGSIVLNSTAEFCRTLGDIPTYGLSGNREEEEQELLDFEREMKEEKKRYEEERKNKGAWNQVEIDDRAVEIIPSEVPILDVEPDVGSGVAGALRLALSKGYLEKETENRPSASRFAHLQAQNYSIDDKAHGDDEKFGRRDRYVGPTTDFKEKDNYKPNVKLDYIDDDGHLLNPKEAFRYLSHKFHGKGPGKNKVEKRMKKNEQEGLMKQMSSTDTPLRTLTMLQQKQKETQSPFVVLSGNKQLSTTSISKLK